MLPYEEDVHIPWFVRLPGRAGARPSGAAIVGGIVINIDLAPTLLDLAGYPEAPDMDGRSFMPLLEAAAARAGQQTEDDPATAAAVGTAGGRSFLIEYYPIKNQGADEQTTVKGEDGWCTDPDCIKDPCPLMHVVVDNVNNTYACVRTLSPADDEDTIFCHFWDGTGCEHPPGTQHPRSSQPTPTP